MKRGMLITLSLLLLPGWTASGQQSEGLRISIQGGQAVQPARGKKEQATQSLTNESIVKLVKAGLGEDTISSMVNTQPGTYLLGADDIIALKQAGVSERIITAMLNKPANELAPATPARVSEKQGQPSQGVSTAPVLALSAGPAQRVATVNRSVIDRGPFPSVNTHGQKRR